ncbi:FAD binding domain-containing protein [Reyranella sp.]
MKPARFDYVAPTTLDAAIKALVAANGEGKVMAGGQSLMPLLNLRLSRPALVVDLMKVPGLSFIEDRGKTIAIGALTRHVELEQSELLARKLPVMSAAMRYVAHLAIRNRGTIGGSISHADPAAELPMLAVFHGATIRARGPNGARAIPAEEFFVAALTTCLEAEEIVYEVEFPVLHSVGWGFEEVSRRFGDFALACIALSIECREGVIGAARVGAMGIDDTPRRLRDAEAALVNTRREAAASARFAEAVRNSVSPPSDLHGSSEYRRSLIGALAQRALATAWARTVGEAT